MLIDYKKIELYGKVLIQKVELKSPFEYSFPVSDYACLIFSLNGDLQFHANDKDIDVPHNYSLLLNCLNTGKRVNNSASSDTNGMVIISFHADVLKKIYQRELPGLLQSPRATTTQSIQRLNNHFLIRQYVEGLLFYLENPALVNDDILVLKLKEIILLLSQNENAESIQVILSQIFSSNSFSFREMIEANLYSQVGIEDLAAKANLSLSTFKREFARIYNESPAKYIRTKRLEKAAGLLLASDSRISDIAYECGFNDLATFTKSFHDKYQVATTSYRLSRIDK